ncbi:MAG: hypothetical protein NUV84_02465 [Candidatus Uhrbacteria bacterium]|nr:hypothetical protein [Candidatus Uhrbacteria bacterium]
MPHVEQPSDPSRFRLSPDQTDILKRYARERIGVQHALMLRTGGEMEAPQWVTLYADRFRELFLSDPSFREDVLRVADSMSKSTPTDAIVTELNNLQNLLEQSSDEIPH